jgi:hypothetical protein
MWESILPTQAEITQQQKLRWSNIDIGTDAQNLILLKTDFTWTVHSPIHGFNVYYPVVDHTLNKPMGNYLLLRADEPRKLGDRAVLMSDRYDIDPNNRTFCLKFFSLLKNTAKFFVYSKLEIFQSENYKQVKKIYQISGFNPRSDWMAFNITVKPENPNSINMWFYLVSVSMCYCIKI